MHQEEDIFIGRYPFKQATEFKFKISLYANCIVPTNINLSMRLFSYSGHGEEEDYWTIIGMENLISHFSHGNASRIMGNTFYPGKLHFENKKYDYGYEFRLRLLHACPGEIRYNGERCQGFKYDIEPMVREIEMENSL